MPLTVMLLSSSRARDPACVDALYKWAHRRLACSCSCFWVFLCLCVVLFFLFLLSPASFQGLFVSRGCGNWLAWPSAFAITPGPLVHGTMHQPLLLARSVAAGGTRGIFRLTGHYGVASTPRWARKHALSLGFRCASTQQSPPAAAAAAAAGENSAAQAPPIKVFGVVDPFSSFYQLSKPVLSGLVVASGTAGFLMAGSPIHFGALASVTVGTFLTAFSANTFNQCYEVKTDALMKRTRNRPLPSGKLSVKQALGWGALCGVTGYGVLALGCNQLTALLGVGNIALYSLIYTPMKQTSILNTWVGSVVGAIPPLMGWAAATGNLYALEPWMVASVLYLWQFPHFFALAWRGRHDYKAGGHMMVPCLDKAGTWTAKLIQRYALYLVPVPAITTGLGLTNSMFLLESILFNGFFLWQCARFGEAKTTRNAQKVFRHSLWYLPVMLSLMVYHSTNWDRKPKSETLTTEATSLEEKAEMKLEEWRANLLEYCPHEVLKTLNIAIPETRSPNFCPKTVMDNLTSNESDKL